MQGATHPAKVVIRRQPFEEVGRRSDNIFGEALDEVIGERGWISRPPHDFIPYDVYSNLGYFDDFNTMLENNLLRFFLGSTTFLGDAADVTSFFKSHPNEMDSKGVYGDTDAKADPPNSPQVFRDLPDNGRRSPRSALFCSMFQSGIAPDVGEPETSEVCQSYEPAHSEPRVSCPFVDDEPLSDAQECHKEAGSLSEMLQLVGDDHHDVSDGQMRDMLGDHGVSGAISELFQVEQADVVDSYARKICWDPSELEKLRSTIARHFAQGESITSAAMQAAISDIEDEYLAEEEEDEAASALSCSQQRLALEVRRFVGHFRSPISST